MEGEVYGIVVLPKTVVELVTAIYEEEMTKEDALEVATLFDSSDTL